LIENLGKPLFQAILLLSKISNRPGKMTDLKDLVLIYLENHPAFFARVETITPDIKPGWVRLKFLILTIPPELGEWILLPEYIQGEEFTMGGKKIRIEKVEVPVEPHEPPEPKSEGKIVSLSERRRK
jgi:hypothetical protein